jgi:S1-C subfamily serine protease
MNLRVYISGASAAHLRSAGGVGVIVRELLICLLLVCPGAAWGRQSATTPAPPQFPAKTRAPQAPVKTPHAIVKTPAAKPPQTGARRGVGGDETPRAQRPAAAATTPVAPAAPAQTAPPGRLAAPAPLPPRQVVTVVHRLSGWKLLMWLATSGPPTLELDGLPTTADAHTNIVAGYIYEDGRNVVARLPQAEVELDSLPAPPALPSLFAANGDETKAEPEYTLVTADGRRVEAKFVGLDASTGLTMLEAKEPLLPGMPEGDEGDTDDPTVGQRVRLYAPALAVSPAPVAGGAPQADAGFIYMSIDRKEGMLTELKRAPSGKLFSVVARANVSPEWTGAVAANELGEVVGIVSQSLEGETRIVPLANVRSACERVLKLRGSAPQPWLGVRGDAAFQSSLETWVSLGWKPEFALPHIKNHQGVFLTSVAPGTPAALAGLRPGDLIARVGPREVRSVEDLSQTLKEAGVGSKVDLTIWRSFEPVPLNLPVELKGTRNPALATAEAEERAVRANLLAVQQEIRDVRIDEQRLRSDPGRAVEAELLRLSARLSAAEGRLEKLRAQVAATEAKVNAARAGSGDATQQRPPVPGESYAAAARLEVFGLSAIGLTPRGAARLGARGGLLVVVVRPESPADAGGVRAGDVIETVNGAPFGRLEFRRLLSAPDATPLSLGLVRDGTRLTIAFSPVGADEPQR